MKNPKKIARYSEGGSTDQKPFSVMGVIQPMLDAMKETRETQRQINLVIEDDPTVFAAAPAATAEPATAPATMPAAQATAPVAATPVPTVSAQVVPKDDTPGRYKDVARTPFETDLSWAHRKSKSVNITSLNDKIAGYLNTLPERFRNELTITSGNDQKHATHSKHYHNNAVDLRFNPELHKYIAGDPYARELGLRVLDPNHGTAAHTHLEIQEAGGRVSSRDNMTAPPVRIPDRKGDVIRSTDKDVSDQEGFWDLVGHKLRDDQTEHTQSVRSDHYTKPAVDILKKTSALAQWIPIPAIKYPAMAINSSLGAVDAYEAYRDGDTRQAIIEAAAAIPLPASLKRAAKIGPYEKQILQQVAKSAYLLTGLNMAQTAQDFTDDGKITTDMTKLQHGGFVLPHYRVGAETPGYPQYRPDTQEAISGGRLVGASTLDGIEQVQHRQQQFYGSGNLDMNEFFGRQKNITDTIPGFDPSNQDHVRQFQDNYNQAYRAHTGKDYFDGAGPRAVDGKFGKYTWSAPSMPAVKQPQKGFRYERLTQLGKEQFARVPTGDWGKEEFLRFNNSLPAEYNGVPVIQGDTYKELYGDIRRGTQTWKSEGDNPLPVDQLPSAHGNPSAMVEMLRKQQTAPAHDTVPVPEIIPADARPVRQGIPGKTMTAYSPTFALGGEGGFSMNPSQDQLDFAGLVYGTPGQPEGTFTRPHSPGERPTRMEHPSIAPGEQIAITPTKEQMDFHNQMYGTLPDPGTGQSQQKPDIGKWFNSDTSAGIRLGMETLTAYKTGQQNKMDQAQRAMQSGFAQNAFGVQRSSAGQRQIGHFEEGGEYDLSDEEIALLKARGYDIEEF